MPRDGFSQMRSRQERPQHDIPLSTNIYWGQWMLMTIPENRTFRERSFLERDLLYSTPLLCSCVKSILSSNSCRSSPPWCTPPTRHKHKPISDFTNQVWVEWKVPLSPFPSPHLLMLSIIPHMVSCHLVILWSFYFMTLSIDTLLCMTCV